MMSIGALQRLSDHAHSPTESDLRLSNSELITLATVECALCKRLVDAFEEGDECGWEHGYDAGYAAGWREGYDNGHEEGWREGFETVSEE